MTVNAFSLFGPSEPDVPLVLDSPHSGVHFPDDFGAQVSVFDLRDGEDSFIDELYMPATEHGVPLLAANFARTYIDANRHEGDVDLELLGDAWPHEHVPSGKAAIGKALVWRTLTDGREIYARRLTSAQLLHRIEHYHRPYHQELRRLLDRCVARHGQVFHINCHSMGSTAGAMSGGKPGDVRADFVIGDRDGSSCGRDMTELVYAHLKQRGYHVAINDPYKGVELVRAYSNPAARRHSLQLEVNKRLYMNEQTREKTAGFGQVQKDVMDLIQRLIGFAAQAGQSTQSGVQHA